MRRLGARHLDELELFRMRYCDLRHHFLIDEFLKMARCLHQHYALETIPRRCGAQDRQERADAGARGEQPETGRIRHFGQHQKPRWVGRDEHPVAPAKRSQAR